MKKLYRLILSLILTLSLAGCTGPVAAAASATSGAASVSAMEVHFIDVGQGDSTLIKSGDHYMLIDAGDDTKGTLIQNYLQKRGIEKLDYLVLTHPDLDHIGGAPVIITKFKIDKVFMSNFEKDNKTYQKLIQSLDDKHLKYTTPSVGSTYTLGSAQITILGPNKEYDSPNNASIALMVQNGSNRFLFTGDAEAAAEADILDANSSIRADVYKVGHHGSKTSTTTDFLREVNPAHAVISCAEGNSYGHPHAETLNNLRAKGVKVYRTDEDGTIIATSDGTKITFDVPASETWKSGEPTGSAAGSSSSSSAAGNASAGTLNTGSANTGSTSSAANELTYVLNSKTKKFHKASCSSLPTTNRVDTSMSRSEVISSGYEACKKCNP